MRGDADLTIFRGGGWAPEVGLTARAANWRDLVESKVSVGPAGGLT